MRFNSKELAHLAQQNGSHFDREGILQMKQKNEKLFRKGEAFVERFFRLRGNLLFYFKSKESINKQEPQGVLVLERCTVELDSQSSTDCSFIIVFEGDDETYTFLAASEKERDGWIEALHTASYECLKMQLLSLREQVQLRTGQDPFSQMMRADTGMEFETLGNIDSNDPAMEMSLTIEGLPNESNGQPPNPFAVVYIIIPPQQQNWLQHNHTEMVENNNNPHFLKTIGFGDSGGLEPTMRVKITVFHVKERMTGMMTQIGQVIFTLNDVLQTEDLSLKLALVGNDGTRVGMLSIVSWLNDTHGNTTNLSHDDEDVFTNIVPTIRGRTMSVKRRSKRLETLKPLCANITTRTFRFETNDSVKLLVHEYMAESKFAFDLPIKTLQLLIEEEKTRIKHLQDLGQLTGQWKAACAVYQDICMSTVTTYTQQMKYLHSYQGCSFKPSSKKADKELEFVPLNLHLQRMTVLNEATESWGAYDVITAGAFVAHSRRARNHGGLKSMLHKLQESYTPEGTLSKVSKVKRACDLVNCVHLLQGEINTLCDSVCHEALQGDGSSLQAATLELEQKVKDLVLDCQSPILQEVAAQLTELHEDSEALAEEQTKQRQGQESQVSPESGTGSAPQAMNWRWTGSCFIKSPTSEPWDMTRVNTEASLVCLTSMVEDLVLNKSGPLDQPKWLGEISPAVIKLKSFVEIICCKVTYFMSFLDLIEHKDNLKLFHSIKVRRDIVFSQALTSLVTGLVLHLNALIDNKQVLEQLATLGVVMEIEGLLSCHGDEIPMLEDMLVAVDDLSTVSFQLVLESTQRKSVQLSTNNFTRASLYPDLNRHHVCVTIPLPQASFEKLPDKLQKGDRVSVVPIFFNIGINELATLAEKFGSTSLQDKLNEESLGRMFRYVKEYENLYMHPQAGGGVGSIPSLMQQLHNNVYTKKSKNVEILHLGAELCRKLHGFRVTSCKSAKDRTAMAVTLEQAQILQREHNLASHVFMQCLDCFRSEGVRRENAFKNIGQRKYAFNSLQLLSFPKQYRPPNGTYGNVQN
ncbi:inositol polyphosphate-4-phosphatase type I A-like isoform X2 [Dreissena polymorpha]|nr:inositol polyphosphate-4-phosphatase type I A-like isoform X2 [Dreissena polymorpha]